MTREEEAAIPPDMARGGSFIPRCSRAYYAAQQNQNPAPAIQAPGATPGGQGGNCGTRRVSVTGWGQDWTAINVGTLLTLTDGRGNASNNAGYLEIRTDRNLNFFDIDIGGRMVRFGPGQEQTIAIGGPYSRYETTISWCYR